MNTLVRFRVGESSYALPVSDVRAVRTATGLRPLPDARAGIAGIVSGEPPLTVVDALASGGSQVIVVGAGDQQFGLLVDEVIGLWRVDAEQIGPAPNGLQRRLLCGTVVDHGQPVLLIDIDVLGEWL